jgi:hypothetical protein
MSTQDPKRIVLNVDDVNAALDVWLKMEREQRLFGVNRPEQYAFRDGLICANAIIRRRLERLGIVPEPSND